MFKFLSSRTFLRVFSWVSALLFGAGLVAFVSARWADPAPATNTTTYDPDYQLPVTTSKFTAKDVPREAQRAAADFVLAAVGREDLEKAWTLVHPSLKAGMTKKEWLTGNIPVQYYPTQALSGAPYSVDELSKDRIVLTLVLLPKEGEDVKPQAFIIGMVPGKQGTKQSWLVDYWAPRASAPVPALGES